MRPAGSPALASPAFPRYFRIAGYWVSSYKVFLCIGIYSAILLSAFVGEQSGLSPLRLGAGLLLFAIVGLIGARGYHATRAETTASGVGIDHSAFQCERTNVKDQEKRDRWTAGCRGRSNVGAAESAHRHAWMELPASH